MRRPSPDFTTACATTKATTTSRTLVIGEAREGLRRRDRAGEDDGPDGDHRGREEREGAQEHARDARDEDREQVPRRRR